MEENIDKANENANINNSFDSCSNSNSFRKNILGTNNNLSKSFANLTGNNLEGLEENNNDNKDIKIKKKKKIKI